MENPSANSNVSPEGHIHPSTSTELTNYEPSEFTLFPSLPSELRLKIWKYALQQERYIAIFLKGPYKLSGSRLFIRGARGGEFRGKPTDKSKDYSVNVLNPKENSSLLRVCKELRVEALKFYRVRFPCRFIVQDKKIPGTFLFNPEYDVLALLWAGGARDTFVEFIYDLRMTYDPQRIGLLNLADVSERGDVVSSRAFNVPLSPKVREAFREDLKQRKYVLVWRAQFIDRRRPPPPGPEYFYRLPVLGFTVKHWEPEIGDSDSEDPRKSYLKRFIRYWLHQLKVW